MKPLILQLAVNIVEELRRQSLPRGAHLVEQTLADAFQVSRSPIRQALLYLEREKILEFRTNCGFFLACPATEIGALDIAVPTSREEESYYRIAEDRVRGKLDGHVSEAELMSRYGVSRVKLSKILTRISQEGWAERRPGHGWTFLPILDNVAALEQCYRFRLLIEPAALLEPTYKVDPVLFDRLRNEQASILSCFSDHKKPLDLFEAGARFHEQIIACAGNRFFLEAIRHVNRQRRLLVYSRQVDEGRLNAYQEHLEILTLLEAGQQTTAADLLRDHIAQAKTGEIRCPPT